MKVSSSGKRKRASCLPMALPPPSAHSDEEMDVGDKQTQLWVLQEFERQYNEYDEESDDEELKEKTLDIALKDGYKIWDADLILKVLMISAKFTSVDTNGSYICSLFNNLCMRIASGLSPQKGDDAILKAAFKYAHLLCKSAVNTPISRSDPGRKYEIRDDDTYNLNIGIVNCLKTACFRQGAKVYRWGNEYEKSIRSADAQNSSRLAVAIRTDDTLDGEDNLHRACPNRPLTMEAYATADAMSDNFVCGWKHLKEISEFDDKQINEMLENSKLPLYEFFTSFLVPNILDGNRMRLGNAIATRFFAAHIHSFGVERVTDATLVANSSLENLKRQVTTIVAIVCLAQWAIKEYYPTDESRGIAKGSEEFKETLSLLEDVKRALQASRQRKSESHQSEASSDASDSPILLVAMKANKAVGEAFAQWFQQALSDPDGKKFLILKFAFTSPALRIQFANQMKAKKLKSNVQESWKAYKQETNIPKETKNICVWQACDFLVYARDKVVQDDRLKGSNIFVQALVVFSGIVGNLLNSEVSGPFHLAENTKDLFNSLWTTKGLQDQEGSTLPSFQEYFASSSNFNGIKREHQPKQRQSSCGRTKDTMDIHYACHTRGQHEKSNLASTRFDACMFLLSFKEMLMAEIISVNTAVTHLLPLNGSVQASFSEGQKPAPLLRVLSLMMLPCMKHSSCKKDGVSYLIEHKRRSLDSTVATADNVERPWRQLLGGSVFGTILYPIASSALVDTIDQSGFADRNRQFVHKTSCIAQPSENISETLQQDFRKLLSSTLGDAPFISVRVTSDCFISVEAGFYCECSSDAETKSFQDRFDECVKGAFQSIDVELHSFWSHATVSKWKTTTKSCMQEFATHVERRCKKIFDLETKVKPSGNGPVLKDIDHVKLVCEQQQSFCHFVLQCTKDQPEIWGDFPLTFSIQKRGVSSEVGAAQRLMHINGSGGQVRYGGDDENDQDCDDGESDESDENGYPFR